MKFIDRDTDGTIDKPEMISFLKIFVSFMQPLIKENKKNSFKFLNKLDFPETELSRDIRITSEVEKIFIICDFDEDRKLNFEELKYFLEKVAF